MKTYKCKDTKELVIGYDAYLHTLHWRNKRKHIYKIRNKTCELCGAKLREHFNVHHKTYKRVGNEKDKDLMLLCEDCHHLLHSKTTTPSMLLDYVNRCVLRKNDKSKTRNRRTTSTRQDFKNGAKDTTTNKKKSR